MTKEEFLQTKHFESFGFVPLFNVSKGGRYTHLCTCLCNHDGIYYDILIDEQYNFYCYPKVKNIRLFYKKGVIF